MRKGYILIGIGVGLNTIRLVLSVFSNIPEPISGFVSGFSVSLMLVGVFRLMWMRQRLRK